MVTWNDVKEFCRRLSASTGQSVRLPTEAEWEYACRAGSTTRFYFGESVANLGDYAWYAGNAGGRTHEVGQKQQNAWGLFYDMCGNVRQYCSDQPDELHCVMRGGSWK